MKILTILLLMLVTWIFNAIIEWLILKEYYEEKISDRRIVVRDYIYFMDYEEIDDGK